MTTLKKDVQKLSDEVHQIISDPPSWLLTWGTSAFFFILLLMVAIARSIPYPMIIKASVQIYAQRPAQAVYSPVKGQLLKIFVQNNQPVLSGQRIIAIQSDCGARTITAAFAGKVKYAEILAEGQLLSQGEPVFYLAMQRETFFGKIKVPINDAITLKAGQRVLIKLKKYSAEQNGTLPGTIDYIIPNTVKGDSFNLAKVSLDTNVTDLGEKLFIDEGMEGDAEIITNTTSLLNKLLSGFSKSFRR